MGGGLSGGGSGGTGSGSSLINFYPSPVDQADSQLPRAAAAEQHHHLRLDPDLAQALGAALLLAPDDPDGLPADAGAADAAPTSDGVLVSATAAAAAWAGQLDVHGLTHRANSTFGRTLLIIPGHQAAAGEVATVHTHLHTLELLSAGVVPGLLTTLRWAQRQLEAAGREGARGLPLASPSPSSPLLAHRSSLLALSRLAAATAIVTGRGAQVAGGNGGARSSLA